MPPGTQRHGSLAWSEHWLRDDESLRNIVLRLAHANACSTFVVLSRFRYRTPVTRARSGAGLDLVVPTLLDLDRLATAMRIDAARLVRGTLLPLLSAFFPEDVVAGRPVLKGLFLRGLVSAHLRFCPVCADDGYHSVLYQFLPVACCHRHAAPVRLADRCGSCGRTLPAAHSWEFADDAPEPTRCCPACGIALARTPAQTATQQEHETTARIIDLWRTVTDPNWQRMPLAAVARHVGAARERRRLDGIAWKAPIPKPRMRQLLWPQTGRAPFVTLRDLIALLDRLELTLAELVASDTGSASSGSAGAELDARVLAGIREGSSKRGLLRALRVGKSTLHDAIARLAECGELSPEDAAAYAYRPRCATGEAEIVRRLAAEGMSTGAICAARGLSVTAVNGLRGTGRLPSARRAAVGPSHLTWVDYPRAQRRATVARALDALERGGTPFSVRGVERLLGGDLRVCLRTRSGPFGGAEGEALAASLRTRVARSWVRAYPDPEQRAAATAHPFYRQVRAWVEACHVEGA